MRAPGPNVDAEYAHRMFSCAPVQVGNRIFCGRTSPDVGVVGRGLARIPSFGVQAWTAHWLRRREQSIELGLDGDGLGSQNREQIGRFDRDLLQSVCIGVGEAVSDSDGIGVEERLAERRRSGLLALLGLR